MMFEIVLSIAVLLCLIAIVLGCLDCLFKRKNRFEAFGIRRTTNSEHNAAFSVDIFDADSISEQVIIEPLPDVTSKVSSVPVLRPRITCTDRGKQEATLSLLSVQRSFPRNHLTYLNEIGSGWFGKAIQSEAVHIVAASYTSPVIVKVLRDDASKLEQKQFMEEVNAFRCLEHENLISLLGQCTETAPYLVILEFAAHGDLKTYLVQNKQDVDTLISTNRLVSFALDAASGLACLHRHDYIHNDLAARNCLIMADYTLKIGDYGTSDHLFKDEYYNNGTELLPVRWMAPETLIQEDGIWISQKCSKISDVWSFGILLWEICSLGERPYDNLTDELVLQNVVLNRLVLPSDMNTKLPFKIKMWSLMIRCWEEPSQRMNVEQTHLILEQLKIQLDAMTVVSDFDQRWNHLEQNKVKITSTSMKIESTLAKIIARNVPSATDKALLLYDGLDAPNRTSVDDVIIDIESSGTRSASIGLDDFSSSKINVQPLHTAVGHNLDMVRHSGSSSAPHCQVMRENEFKMASVSASQLKPSATLDQQLLTSTISVSQGPGSTSQFYSPHSSPSSEYITVSESYVATNFQEETVCDIDRDLSPDQMELSFSELIDETLQDSVNQGESSLVNNNNIAFKCVPPPQNEDVGVHTSPATQDEDFLDFESAVTAGSNSFFNIKYVDEGDLCNKDASLFKTDNTFASSKNDTSICSELVAPPEYTSVNNDSNTNANFPCSFSSSSTVNSISGISNSAASSNSDDVVHRADLPSEPESHFFKNLSGTKPKTKSCITDISIAKSDNKTDFQVCEASINLENLVDISSHKMHLLETGQDAVDGRGLQHGISIGIEGSDQDKNIISFELIQQDSSSKVINLQSKSYDNLHENSENVDEMAPSHVPAIIDNFEENKNHFLLSLNDGDNAISSVDCLDKSSSDPSHQLKPTFSEDDGKTGMDQMKVGSSSKNESNSAESGIHSHSLAESPTNHANNYSEMDSSMYLSDSPIYSQSTHLSDSSVAFLQENDNEQDTWPKTFKSNLYRCSRINLTADPQNTFQSEENFKSTDEHGNNCQEDLQSPVDSDSESCNSNSESGQEYICVSPDNLGQLMTSTPDTTLTNIDSNAHIEPSLPVEFDDYALQIASEIYLSRGLKSPRAYEILPLETIPEHQPMTDIQEDSNYTPSDTSSVEVRYDELFGSDSYEWDDFYGDPLIGRDISVQHSLHQHNPSFREHDVSDWSMDIDSESTASGISMLSSQSEVSLNVSTQSELLPSQTDTSFDSGRSLFPSTGSESMASPFAKNNDSSRETLLSSLRSHLQSPSVASMSSIDKNNFYSLTEKYDLEADSSSDEVTRASAEATSIIESPSSFTNLTGHTSVTAGVPSDSYALLSSDSAMSDQHPDLNMPKSPEPNMSTSRSCTHEQEQLEFDISSDKSRSAFDQVSSLLGHSSVLAASQISHAPEGNIDNEDLGAVNCKPGINLLDPDNVLENSSSTACEQDVLKESHESNKDTD